MKCKASLVEVENCEPNTPRPGQVCCMKTNATFNKASTSKGTSANNTDEVTSEKNGSIFGSNDQLRLERHTHGDVQNQVIALSGDYVPEKDQRKGNGQRKKGTGYNRAHARRKHRRKNQSQRIQEEIDRVENENVAPELKQTTWQTISELLKSPFKRKRLVISFFLFRSYSKYTLRSAFTCCQTSSVYMYTILIFVIRFHSQFTVS